MINPKCITPYWQELIDDGWSFYEFPEGYLYQEMYNGHVVYGPLSLLARFGKRTRFNWEEFIVCELISGGYYNLIHIEKTSTGMIRPKQFVFFKKGKSDLNIIQPQIIFRDKSI
jgi:hypothetical protein